MQKCARKIFGPQKSPQNNFFAYVFVENQSKHTEKIFIFPGAKRRNFFGPWGLSRTPSLDPKGEEEEGFVSPGALTPPPPQYHCSLNTLGLDLLGDPFLAIQFWAQISLALRDIVGAGRIQSQSLEWARGGVGPRGESPTVPRWGGGRPPTRSL